MFKKHLGSRKSLSYSAGALVVVALIAVILSGYFVTLELPGSLPTSTTTTGITYTSTLTGNITDATAQYSVLPTQMANYSTIFIQDGAYIDRVAAFNPLNAVVVLGVNATVEWRNVDTVTQSFVGSNGIPSSGNLTALVGTFTYTFTTPGVYSYASQVYPWENGTVTVVQ